MKEGFDLRCPTGIVGIDSRLDGGLPYTLSILVHGATGGGAREFVHTICANVASAFASPGLLQPPARAPKDLSYITLTKPRADILQEMSWLVARRAAIGKQAHFYDLLSKYFGKGDFVDRWMDEEHCIHVPDVSGLLESLRATLDSLPPSGLVIIDSVSDLATHSDVTAGELSRFLRGLQVATNRWESVVIMLHTDGLIPADQQREILDASDAALELSHEQMRAGDHRYRLRWGHIRGLPVPLTDFDRIYGIVTEDGMRVVELERVG